MTFSKYTTKLMYALILTWGSVAIAITLSNPSFTWAVGLVTGVLLAEGAREYDFINYAKRKKVKRK